MSSNKNKIQGYTTKPGDNRAVLMHNLELSEIGEKQADFSDPEDIKYRIERYFQICAKNDMKPNVAGFALICGVDRSQITRWVSGVSFKGAEESRRLLLHAYRIINGQMEDYMLNGLINPVCGIFIMKNNMGYEDKSTQVVAQHHTISVDSTPEQLSQKYLEMVNPEYIEAPPETLSLPEGIPHLELTETE